MRGRGSALVVVAALAIAPDARAQAPLRPDSDTQIAPLSPDTGRSWSILPFVGFRQGLNFSDSGDPRAYTSLSAGVDAFIRRERIQATLSYDGNYRIPLSGGSGRLSNRLLARGTGMILTNRLWVDASAYTALTNRDFSQRVVLDPELEDTGNVAQTSAFSISPRFRHEIGNLAIVNASYRLSYINVDDRVGGSAPGFGNSGGQRLLPSFSDSVGNTFTASIANQPAGRLQATLSGNLTYDDQDRFKQRYRNEGGSLDLAYAFNRQWSLLGNIGYTAYDSSQQAILRGPIFVTNIPSVPPNPFADGVPTTLSPLDPDTYRPSIGGVVLVDIAPAIFLANGFTSTRSLADPNLFINSLGSAVLADITPVIGANGDFQPDPSLPRQTLYRQRGLVWNAGFRYIPSPRTSFEIRAGQRFSSITVTGSLRHILRNGAAITASLTDGIETFGQILTQTINGVPTSFTIGRTRPGFQGGCVVGADPGNFPTQCIDGRTQSITSGVFRSRIGSINFDQRRGRISYGGSFTYNLRTYLNSGATIGIDAQGIDPTFGSREDQVIRFDLRGERGFRPGEQVSLGIYLGNYNLGLARPRNDYYVGSSLRYGRRFTDKLSFNAQLLVNTRLSEAVDPITLTSRADRTSAVISAGARYEF